MLIIHMSAFFSYYSRPILNITEYAAFYICQIFIKIALAASVSYHKIHL